MAKSTKKKPMRAGVPGRSSKRSPTAAKGRGVAFPTWPKTYWAVARSEQHMPCLFHSRVAAEWGIDYDERLYRVEVRFVRLVNRREKPIKVYPGWSA